MTTQEYISQHPFLRPIVETQAEVDRFVDGVSISMEFPSVEESKKLVAGGIPILQHDAILGAVVDVITDALRKIPTDDEVTRAQVESVIRQDAEAIAPRTRLLIWRLIDRLVPTEIKSSECWLDWKRNYCPVCGRRAVMAQLRKESQGRARFLLCDGCRTMWEYQRLGCAYCGNDDLDAMRILVIDAEPQIRLDVCDKCHAYMKTYNEQGTEEIYLNDRLTLHFDLLAEDEGVHKVGSVLIE